MPTIVWMYNVPLMTDAYQIRAIIIDDELKSLESLEWLIQIYFPECNVISKFQDPLKGLLAVEKEEPELLFLDIQMPIMNGFQFLTKMKSKTTRVIFITAYNEKIPKTLQMLNIPFLLKPIDHEELESLVDKVRTHKIEKPGKGKIEKLTNIIWRKA